jgi:hypothetical protein
MKAGSAHRRRTAQGIFGRIGFGSRNENAALEISGNCRGAHAGARPLQHIQ